MRYLGFLAVVLLVAGCSAGPGATPTAVATKAAAPPAATKASGSGEKPTEKAAEKPAEKAAAKASRDKVKVGVLGSSVDAPFWLAETFGYYDEQSLDVENIKFASGNDSLPQLGTGAVDVVNTGVNAALFNLVNRNIQIKVAISGATVQKESKWFALVVRKDLTQSGAVKKVEDLKGKRIAVSATGGSGDFMLGQLLQKHGVSINDVTLEKIVYPDMPLAFANKGIDASVLTEPYVTNSASSGDTTVLSYFGDEIDPTQIGVLSYSQDFATKRSAVAKRFATAYVKAQRDYADAFEKGVNKAKVIQIVAENAKTKPEVLEKSAPSTYPRSGVVLVESLKRQHAFFLARGFLQQQGEFNMDALVDGSFVQEAGRVLGP